MAILIHAKESYCVKKIRKLPCIFITAGKTTSFASVKYLHGKCWEFTGDRFIWRTETMFKNVPAEAEISWLLDPAVSWATEQLDPFVKALLQVNGLFHEKVKVSSSSRDYFLRLNKAPVKPFIYTGSVLLPRLLYWSWCVLFVFIYYLSDNRIWDYIT